MWEKLSVKILRGIASKYKTLHSLGNISKQSKSVLLETLKKVMEFRGNTLFTKAEHGNKKVLEIAEADTDDEEAEAKKEEPKKAKKSAKKIDDEYIILIDKKVAKVKKFLEKVKKEEKKIKAYISKYGRSLGLKRVEEAEKRFGNTEKKLREELKVLKKEGRDKNNNLYLSQSNKYFQSKYGDGFRAFHPTAPKDPYFNAEEKKLDPLYNEIEDILDELKKLS